MYNSVYSDSIVIIIAEVTELNAHKSVVAHRLLGNGALEIVSSLLILLVDFEGCLNVVINIHIVVFIFSIAVSSTLSTLLWRSHQLCQLLLRIDAVQDATSILKIIDVEQDIKNDTDSREGAKEHHEPEVAVLPLSVQELTADQRSDGQANVLDGCSETVSSTDEASWYTVRDATPNSGGID